MPESPKEFLRRMSAQKDSERMKMQQALDAANEKRERDRRLAAERRRIRQPAPAEGVPESEAAQWVRDNLEWEEYPELWVPSMCSWSDYSGGALQQSNGKALIRDHPEVFKEEHGGHGTVWVGMTEETRLALTPEQWEGFKDDIEGLEDYPVLDEELMSEIEMEAKWKDWQEYGRAGLREALVKQWNGDVDAQIAVVAKRNQFWDECYSGQHGGDGLDQHQVEEDGGNWYFHADHAAKTFDREEIVNEDEVEAAKKALFFKDYANVLEQALAQAQVFVHTPQQLWDMVKHTENQVGPDEVWEVNERYHEGENEECDLDDHITFHPEPVVATMSAPEQVQKMLHRHWEQDPRQLKLPGYESMAQALAASLLEAEDPKSVLRQLPHFKFKIAGGGEQVMLQAEEGDDWPIPLGVVIQDPDRKFRICSGSPTRLGWKWWENVQPDVFALQFDVKDAAAKHLWVLWKQSGQVREAETPKAFFRQPGPCPLCQGSGKNRKRPDQACAYCKGRGSLTPAEKAGNDKFADIITQYLRHEAEDPKAFLKRMTPTEPPRNWVGNLPRKIEIWGRRWFSRTYGNTYFTARIYVDDQLVHTMPEEYGYGQQYMDRSYEWLEDNGYVPPRPRNRNNVPDPPWAWCREHNIEFLYHAEDIRVRRDRFV